MKTKVVYFNGKNSLLDETKNKNKRYSPRVWDCRIKEKKINPKQNYLLMKNR